MYTTVVLQSVRLVPFSVSAEWIDRTDRTFFKAPCFLFLGEAEGLFLLLRELRRHESTHRFSFFTPYSAVTV